MSEYPLDYLSNKESLLASGAVAPPNSQTFTSHLSQTNPAKWTYQRLAECVNSFEENLDNEHEIGTRLVSSGSSVSFHLQGISYYAPDIINFYGKSEHGEELQLIQHVSQLNVLFITMKKLGDEPVRVGLKLKRG